jgi:hypothetical protein
MGSEWNKTHRKECNEALRRWRQAHPRVRVRRRGRRQAHPEEIRECNRRWREAHREQVREYRRRWNQTHPERLAYRNAKHRCENRANVRYKHYGGRGIEFRFKSFDEFFTELGPRPTPKHSVDRFPNNDGHYEPGNVRWATPKEQRANQRRIKEWNANP